jgi:protein gp37
MSDRSAIEWTDATWNPVRGCTKVSPGCKFCYAEVFAERFRGVPEHPFEQAFDLRLVPEKLDQPLHWRRPRKIFVNSMSDLFHEDVPPGAGVARTETAVPTTVLSGRNRVRRKRLCWNRRNRTGFQLLAAD